MSGRGLRWVCGLAALLLCGCGGPTRTVRELGHPEFERYVGAQTAFRRPDERQIKGLDAYPPDTVDGDADHGFFITIWPTGDAEQVWIGIEVQPRGELPLKQLVAAVFPATAQEAASFEVDGRLPQGAEPLLVADEPIRGGRGMAVKMLFDRAKLPAGKDHLAIPTLTQFEDGWINIRFYKTKVPATPQELGVQTKPPARAGTGPAKDGPAKDDPAKDGPAKDGPQPGPQQPGPRTPPAGGHPGEPGGR
ncbi:MAG: hypothetical protein AB7N76_32865 [Planctomycetota bacterium]